MTNGIPAVNIISPANETAGRKTTDHDDAPPHRARAAIDHHASLLHTGELMALPVSMARPGSKRPKRGDVLATTREASGLVAVALCTGDTAPAAS